MGEILWPMTFGEEDFEENNSKDIIKTQAKALQSLTNGLVSAVFTKLTYRQVNKGYSFEGVGKFFKEIGPRYEEDLEPELDNKKDASVFFHTEKFKFEIYSDKYRFRVFILKYHVLYPITLEIDEDIADDLKIEYIQEIKSNSDLKEQLRKIFASKKLYTIINYIMMRSK